MKFSKIILAALTCTTLAAASAHAETWMSIGSAPSEDGGGVSLSIATKKQGPWAFGFGVVFNSNFSKDLLDYPVPHSNYTDLGTKRTGTSLGVDAMYFFGDNPSTQPYVGIGAYYSQRKDVAQSNVTGWYYTQSDQSTTMLSGELGLRHVYANGYILGIGYHTVRGANISVGKAF